jgi:hypothetical protein
MKCLGLHNKPKAEVHPGHMLMDPIEEEEGVTHGFALRTYYTIVYLMCYTEYCRTLKMYKFNLYIYCPMQIIMYCGGLGLSCTGHKPLCAMLAWSCTQTIT